MMMTQEDSTHPLHQLRLSFNFVVTWAINLILIIMGLFREFYNKRP